MRLQPANFCADCGKRNGPEPHIHTCSPPSDRQPAAWMRSSDGKLFTLDAHNKHGSGNVPLYR